VGGNTKREIEKISRLSTWVEPHFGS